ncbi:Tyrosine-protein phosphatase non-receptor type 1 [Thelohanellus kitauei]|uniref:Tyrosine-protein phosphatase non-receptor type 1 n=1 Tax=Thelohanellus kitauei TaxID=669202 RepID=A0A0C2J9T2_THEKT|nr:Tyrosine-protein phosphatase non-receptor type 1 [Thelohanellus kitauei]
MLQYIDEESEFTYQHLSTKEAKAPSNIRFNRYSNIHPYDISRVQLTGENEDRTDYINANCIKIPNSNKRYIACQHPMESTAKHFWQMVWEQNVTIIVMLNCLSERNHIQYWPHSYTSKNYGSYIVSVMSERSNETYELRQLEITYTKDASGRKQTVYHYAYKNWSDFGVPKSIQDFLTLMNDVNTQYQELALDSPIVVHCSAGVGRTGTYMLIDSCYQQFLAGNNGDNMNPMYTLTDMRQYRKGLVQTSAQLRFAYHAIGSLIRQRNQHQIDRNAKRTEGMSKTNFSKKTRTFPETTTHTILENEPNTNGLSHNPGLFFRKYTPQTDQYFDLTKSK